MTSPTFLRPHLQDDVFPDNPSDVGGAAGVATSMGHLGTVEQQRAVGCHGNQLVLIQGPQATPVRPADVGVR